MTSSDVLSILASILVVLIGAAVGLGTYFNSRRNASGKVETSEATILWQQSQDIRAMLQAEKVRAEDQRDRLIDAYTRQVFPVLNDTNTLVVGVAEGLAAVARDVHAIRASLEGGADVPQLAPPEARADGR